MNCAYPDQKDFAHTGFHRVKAGDANKVTITKTTGFSISARGCADDLADLELSVDANQQLNIRFRNYGKQHDRVEFEITMPQLVSLHLSGASDGLIMGFGDQQTVMRTFISGASACKVEGTAASMQLDVAGASKLVMLGNTDNLFGHISGASRLEAFGVQAKEVDISVNGDSRAYVKPVEKIFAEATGNSRFYYTGNPASTRFETSGNGKIIYQ